MATTVAKVRLVRCPKCLKLLPEMVDVPMYQCGGCGAILKAKYHDPINQNVSLISDVSQNLSHNDSSNESQVEQSTRPILAENCCYKNQEPSGVAGAIDITLSQNVESNNVRTVQDRRFSGSFGTRAKDGEKSLDSHAFYSIRSGVESDNNSVPSRSLSRRSAFSEDPTRNQIGSSSKFKNRELLKLVEELTDQLGRSYQLKEKKKKSFPCSRNEARTSKKSYCRPVSGGAPFVICTKCLEVLHMPADFLVSRNRLSKLNCGSCSQVMVLSFPALACNESGNPTEGPDSFSEEYGISFADTSSVGTEAVLNVSKASSGTLHQLMGYPSARVLPFENNMSLK